MILAALLLTVVILGAALWGWVGMACELGDGDSAPAEFDAPDPPPTLPGLTPDIRG